MYKDRKNKDIDLLSEDEIISIMKKYQKRINNNVLMKENLSLKHLKYLKVFV